MVRIQSAILPLCAFCDTPVKRLRSRFCSRACINRSRTLPLLDRFFRYVGHKTATGCILWTGYLDQAGYGSIGSGPPQHLVVRAHRVSYELFRGVILAGSQVLHNCPGGDNPACVNPYHLWLGTNIDNMADRGRKGRQAKGETQWKSVLTEDLVRLLRRRYAVGNITKTDLAREFELDESTVRASLDRKTWKHVSDA